MSNKLTERVVDALRSGQTLWDGEIKGFGCRRRAEGRYYVIKYRFGARQRWLTIGTHGKDTNAADARRKAQRLLGEVRNGRDPAGVRDHGKAAPTVSLALDRFIEEHVKAKLRPTTISDYTRSIRLVVRPELGQLQLEALTVRDIAKVHHGMRATPYQANRVLALISKFLSWAVRNHLRTGMNPAAAIERFDETARERFLSGDELGRLGDVLGRASGEGLASLYTVAAIKLLVFTGARLSEILTLEWGHVDWQRGLLNLATSKTGKKSIHLSAPALQVLAELPRIEGNRFVIVGERAGQHLVNLQKPWRRIRAAAGLPDVRLHDLRHSFASVAAARGGSLPLIGKLLGHTQAQTTARYAHLAAEPVRELNDSTGQALAAALAGGSGNVVNLRKQG